MKNPSFKVEAIRLSKAESHALPRATCLVWLLLVATVTTCLAQPVVWSGSGDAASWHDPLNWTGGAVPGAANDVIITNGLGTNVVISSGNKSIKSIYCSRPFAISGGSLTVTAGSSSLEGAFNMAAGTALTASGVGVTFTCSGPTSADGASLYASGGAVLSLPGLANYIKTACATYYWRASGTNSVVELPALTNMTVWYDCGALNVQAQTGGRVILTNLARLDGQVAVLADGGGSLADLSRLVTVAGTAGSSSYTAQNGGVVLVPAMVTGQNASFAASGGSALSVPLLVTLQGGSLSVGGGSALTLPSLVTMSDASLFASGGAVLSLPGLANYTKTACGTYYWRASGTNSVVALPALTNMTVSYNCGALNVQAQTGGQMILTNLTRLDGQVAVLADGGGSLVDLSRLVTVAGTVGSSSYTAQNGGVVRVPAMATGQNASFAASGGSALSVPSLVTLQGGSLSVGGGSALSLPALVALSNAGISVSGGGLLSLPGLANYTKETWFCGGNLYWKAEGTNSVVALPALTNMTVSYNCGALNVQALGGGQVILTNLARLDGAVVVLADGGGSLADLSQLVTVAGTVGSSSYTAQNGGVVRVPAMATGQNASFAASGGSALSVPALVTLQGGSLSVGGGSALSLPALVALSNAGISVSGGGLLELPGLANYTKETWFCGGNLYWKAEGTNSVVALPALTNMTVSYSCGALNVQALGGGQVILTNLARLDGQVAVLADGGGSLVDLSRLVTVAGTVGSSSYTAQNGGVVRVPAMATGQNASFAASGGSALSVPSLVTLQGGSLSVGGGSALTLPSLVTMSNASLYASGGAVLSLPGLAGYTKTACATYYWRASGTNSVVELPALTNMTVGSSCGGVNVQAQTGGQMILTNLTRLDGQVAVLADGGGSLVDLSRLVTVAGTVGSSSYTAQNGGVVRVPAMATGQNASFAASGGSALSVPSLVTLQGGSLSVGGGSALTLPSLVTMSNASLYASGGAVLSLPGLARYTKTACATYYWRASGTNSVVELPALTNMTVGSSCGGVNVQAQTGGQVILTNLARLDGEVVVLADGGGSLVDLSRLVTVAGTVGSPSFTAQNGGTVRIPSLVSITSGRVSFVADGTGSIIELSCLATRGVTASSFIARNGGTIHTYENAFLLANATVNIPGHPVLPVIATASTSLTLYGRAWHSYWIEKRNTANPASDWTFVTRVPLTNDTMVFASLPPANTAFRVWEFMADPPILDLFRQPNREGLLILYGATNKTYQIESAPDLNPGTVWQPGDTADMTNTFRILPTFPMADPVRFFRGKEL